MQDLRITLIQPKTHWEDIGANLAMLEEKIWQIGTPTDIIILPEMFSTGFTMNAHGLAEHMNMRAFKWMKQMASQTGALILGSMIVQDHDQYYNRLIWMEPGGAFKTYDKRHLFRMAEEHGVYTPGENLLIAEWKGWRICPLICYDLRFPAWSRNHWNQELKDASYDLLVFVANWPKVRINAWETLLKARAIENLSYVIGVNRVGTDGYGIEYNGQSCVIDPRGDQIFLAGETEAIYSTVISLSEVQSHRKRFPALMDADEFSIERVQSRAHLS
jgi:omega-amidase